MRILKKVLPVAAVTAVAAGCLLLNGHQLNTEITNTMYADIYVQQLPSDQMSVLHIDINQGDINKTAVYLNNNVNVSGYGAAEWHHIWTNENLKHDANEALNAIYWWKHFSPVDCFWFNYWIPTGTGNVDVGWRPDEDQRCDWGEAIK